MTAARIMNSLDAYYHLVSRIAPNTPVARSRLLYRFLWGWLYDGVRKPSIGLFQPDGLLGWANRENIVAVHPAFEFRVTYRTGSDGARLFPAAAAPPSVLALGCSWTFGHGVEDSQTYCALLSSEHKLHVRNGAVMGYGPAHAYLQLDRILRSAGAADAPATVTYCWVPDQLIRAWRRAAWIRLNSWVNPGEPSHPVFDLTPDGLVFRGLVGMEGAVEDDVDWPDFVTTIEWELTVELLTAINRMASGAGKSFLVIVPPLRSPGEEAAGQRLAERLARRGVRCTKLRLAAVDTPSEEDLFYPFDGHPKPGWHRSVAVLLADALSRLDAVTPGAGS